MNILFYIDTMNMGGAARMISLIANKLAERDYQVSIATNTNNEIVYHIDERVHVCSLYPKDAYKGTRIFRLLKLIINSRKIAKNIKPDIIVTTIPAVTFFAKVGTMGLHIPTIFCDVTSYARKDSTFVHFVRYHFYKLAEAVTIETENDRRLLGKRLSQKVVINDPLTFDVYHGDENRDKVVLGIGPLNEWDIKGFDMLFEAFGMIAHKHPDWQLHIAGALHQKSQDKILKPIIEKYGFKNQVKFLGFQRDISSIMRRSAIFALASRIEGFSLSIIESISQGCPAICFKTVGVMTEVTENGTGAIIVEDGDVADYSRKLDVLMKDENLRKEMSRQGRDFIIKYELGHIVDQWEVLFKKIVK